MSIDSEADWQGLRAVADVVRLTLDALESSIAPGRTTQELDHAAATVIAQHHARSALAAVYGFPGAVLISVNDEVVHGVPGPRRLKLGDLVKIDVTLEKGGYVADAARTVLIGEGSAIARRLRRAAESAFDAAMQVARAGNRVNQLGRAIEATVTKAGLTVVRSLSGHGVGRTIHEPPSVPNYFDRDQADVLTAGLVLAVEPIITAGRADLVDDEDGWTIRTRDGSLAAHYEHTIVITGGDPVILTAA